MEQLIYHYELLFIIFYYWPCLLLQCPVDGLTGDRGAHVQRPAEGGHNIASALAPSLVGPVARGAPRNTDHVF